MFLKSYKIYSGSLFFSNSGLATIPSILTFSGTNVMDSILPIILVNLALCGLKMAFTLLHKPQRLFWILAFLIGPILLGQPMSRKSLFSCLKLSLYLASITMFHQKVHLINIYLCLCGLVASIVLVLDQSSNSLIF